MKGLADEPITVPHGECLGGCGKPRRWPGITCGGFNCEGSHIAIMRLHTIRERAGRPPWRTGKR